VVGIIPRQVACEFINAARKLTDQGFTPKHAWNRLDEFLMLYPLKLSNEHVLIRAIHLHVEFRYSFWDALIVAACLDAGVPRLYSEDLSGRVPPQELEIVNPFE
jgi:predicted nucleic acid-binding protein